MRTSRDPETPDEEELDAYCEELSLEDEIYDPADEEDFVDNETDWDNDGFDEPTWDAVSDHDSNEGW